MIYTLLAHAGEHHETVKEAVQHSAEAGSSELGFWVALFIIPLLLLGAMKLAKIALSIQLLIISAFLIIFSIVSYQNPGIYSAFALAVGFGLVFTQTIVGLSAKEQ